MAIKGKKLDCYNKKNSKPMWHLLPWKQVEEVVNVLTFGAKKYGENDWKYFISKNVNENRYLSAGIRHIVERLNGKMYDKETNNKVLAHAICCLLFVMWKDDKIQNKKNK